MVLQTGVFCQGAHKNRNSPITAQDSTKLPSTLTDIRFITSLDTCGLLQLTFSTIERPTSLLNTYNLDSLGVYTAKESLTLRVTQKDTACYQIDADEMRCEWTFILPITKVQRELLKVANIDSIVFWRRFLAIDKVYLVGSDKSLLQRKLNETN